MKGDVSAAYEAAGVALLEVLVDDSIIEFNILVWFWELLDIDEPTNVSYLVNLLYTPEVSTFMSGLIFVNVFGDFEMTDLRQRRELIFTPISSFPA